MPPPSPVIRIALVGFGRLGQEVYAPLLRRTDSIEVTIIADPASHCRSVAQLLFPKSEISGSPEAAVASEKCDAVMIAAPPWAHAELALLALQSGKHVYLEKPMTIASSEAERLADAWRESGLVGMMDSIIGSRARCNHCAGNCGPVAPAGSGQFKVSSPSLPGIFRCGNNRVAPEAAHCSIWGRITSTCSDICSTPK